MKERKLESYIQIRIYKSQKERWLKIVKERKSTITDLVINSVEDSFTKGERRQMLSFIEKQGNLFSKIENNINQFARIVNTENSLDSVLLNSFNEHLKVIAQLKLQQNDLFKKIIRLMAKN